MSTQRAVFLDRDGVLNDVELRNGRPHPPVSADAVRVYPEVADACAALDGAGYLLVVVTNQPDIARGTTTAEAVADINTTVGRGLPITAFRVCPHDDNECNCRKPAPGLLTAAAEELDIDLSTSFMVGDRWRDVQAGHAAGCVTFFIDRSYDERAPDHPDYVVRDLQEAADIILSLTTRESGQR